MKFLSHDGLIYFWELVKDYINGKCTECEQYTDTKFDECFQSVSNGKTLVANAITDKGVATNAADTFATMANNISQIKTGSDIMPFNFPLTISTTQPSNPTSGHIWVNSDKESSITSIQIVEELPASISNGTLTFVVGDLSIRSYSYSNNKELTNGTTKSFTIGDDSYNDKDWLIYYQEGIGNMYVRKPMIYSKVNDVLDIETAYLYNGSSWVMVSQQGSYAITIDNYSVSNLYNLTDSGIEAPVVSTFTASTQSSFGCHFNADGTYLLTKLEVYKRIGNTLSLYYTLPADYTYLSRLYKRYNQRLSKNGEILVCHFNYGSSSSDQYHIICIYKNTGSTFEFLQMVSLASGYTSTSTTTLDINYDGSIIVIGYKNGNSAYTVRGVYYDGTKYIASSTFEPPSISSYASDWYSGSPYFWFENNNVIHLLGRHENDEGNKYAAMKYTFDAASKAFIEVSSKKNLSTVYGSSTNTAYQAADNVTGKFYYVSGTTIYVFDPSTNVISSGSIPGTSSTYGEIYGIALNLTGDKLYVAHRYSLNGFYLTCYTMSIDSTTLTLTKFSEISLPTNTHYGVSVCPN